jgi:hypothetical protein
MSTSFKPSDEPSPAHARLSVARCRELLPSTCTLDTDELLALRDWMYTVGDVVFDLLIGEPNGE